VVSFWNMSDPTVKITQVKIVVRNWSREFCTLKPLMLMRA